MLAVLGDHIRLSVRTLTRHPGFAAITIVTLGLGIGATTAIYSVVEAVLLNPLPYAQAGDLVWVQNRYLPGGGVGGVSPAELAEYRGSAGAFEGLAALSLESDNLTGLDTPLRLQGLRVSGSYFDLLRVPFAAGRGFTPEEESPGGPRPVVISHRLWQMALGGDPAVLGRTLVMGGVSRTIVGVVSPGHTPLAGYLFPGRSVDFWTPAVIDPATFDDRTVEIHSLFVLGRLAPGVEPPGAERALLPAVARLEARYPGISSAGSRDVAVTPLQDRIVGDVGSTLWVVLAAVGLLLLLACINVANMLLARGEARLGESSIHSALGAGRSRLALRALTESALIGLCGGGLGILLAFWAQKGLVRLAPPSFPRVDEIGLDVRVLAFCAGISLVAGALAGSLPSLRLARSEPFQELKASGRGGALGRRRTILRRALVVAQVAGAVVIASAAGLLGRTLVALRAVDPGFQPEDLLSFQVNAPRASYGDPAAIRALYRTLLEDIDALPGVAAAAASWQTPLQTGMSDWPVRPKAEESEWVSADPNVVTNDYFETFGIRLVEGRLFDESDLARPEGSVLVSETAARRLFADGRAVGRLVNVNFDRPVWREVVGIVHDVRIRGLGSEPGPQTYFTLSALPFGPSPSLMVTVRTRRSAADLRGAMVDIMRRLDPDIPLGAVTSMEDQVGVSVARERFLTMLLGAFAGTALLLGAIGVYGLLAYDVSRRRREIGLRIALGARPAVVLGGVVRGALLLGAIGVVLGGAGALATSRLLEGFLYGVSSTDPLTVTGVAGVVLAAALLAGWVPARRAAAVDPLSALRAD